MKRAIVIVCDSLGVGELPDAADFGDEGSNTLGHILQAHHPSDGPAAKGHSPRGRHS